MRQEQTKAATQQQQKPAPSKQKHRAPTQQQHHNSTTPRNRVTTGDNQFANSCSQDTKKSHEECRRPKKAM
jgi:hypothetical protein